MVELSHGHGDGSNTSLVLSYGSDTSNTAIYLSRLGVDVGYITALGDDPYSDEMIANWQREGVDTRLVIRAVGRLPGLYCMRTDEQGERSFYYWRERAPARDLFSFTDFFEGQKSLIVTDFIYLSGTTLSLFSDKTLPDFVDLLDAQRAHGGKVIFATNHRSSCWSSDDRAKEIYTEVLKRVDMALPALDDEKYLFNDKNATECATRYHAAGVSEVVVKMGIDGCMVSRQGLREEIPLLVPRKAKDTTGAGDSFNGAYLAARFKGRKPAEAALIAQRLAGKVVMHSGAIIPRDAMPQLSL